MNSEKVKEIKKALKKNIRLGLSYEDNENYCKVWLADILTLINELEKENEILQGTKYRLTFIERIEIADNSRVVALKQFAERLKEKFYYEGRICRYIIDSDVFDETLKEFINE